MLVVGAIIPAWSQITITTERYDTSRTGANLSETTLTTSNVNSTEFGKLYSYSVSGSVQAQPLYVPNLTLPGLGTYNVLFVVTMNDVVYALDADSNATNGNGVLWTNNLTNPAAGVTPIPIVNIVQSDSLNIVGNVGIESTPVIDLSTNTMYLVARTMEVSGTTTNYVTRLHALDITTGEEKFGGPVVVQGSVPGTGQGSSGGVLTFDSLIQNQRSSLALVNGMVVFSFASHEDFFNWHGWIFAYDAQTLQSDEIFCVTPNGQNGGLWMSGRGPVIDSAGNLYYASGNGDWNGESSFGDSVLKLSTAGGTLSLVDYFTPDDYASLQAGDVDLGSSGPLLIPGTSLLLHGGKESVFYLLNTSGLGHEQSGNGQIVQSFATPQGGEIHGGPVFWNRTTNAGPTMYIWPNSGGSLEAYQFNGSTFNTTPISKSTVVAPQGQSGGVLTLSANGSTVGSGIIWSSMPTNQDGDHGLVPGTLRAFDANNLTTELWDSDMVSGNSLGLWPKYSPPTVANGKVYMAAFPGDGVSAGAISVYGLLTANFSLSISPSTQTVVVGNATTYTASIGAVFGFNGTVTLGVSGLPAGATASFVPATVTGTGSSILTVTAGSSTLVGTYPVTITGTSGNLTQTANVSLTVAATQPPPNFTLSVTPSSPTVVAGSPTTYTASIEGLNGFSGVVTLSASGLPAGAAASFAPATVTGAGSSTMTVTTSTTTPLGTYPVTVTGTSGNLTQTASVELTVANATAIGIKFVGDGTAMGSTEVAGVVPQSNWNDASGTSSTTPLALLDQNGDGTSATVTWNTNGVWELPIADNPGNYRMMRGYLDTVGETTTVTVAGLPANAGGYQVYLYADGANGSASRTGAYQISGTGITTTSVNLTDAANTNFSGTFTEANNSAGNYVLFTITATGFTITATPGASTDANPRAPVNAIQIVPLAPTTPSFSLTATPSTETVVVGNATTYTASIGAVDGFSGTVTLSASGLPAGATPSFVPATVTGTGSSILTVTTSSTTPLGTSPLTITGTSGNLTQTANVSLTVAATPPPPNFSLTVTPSTETVVAGSETTYTATIGALNGFGGVVTLSASGLPAGAAASFVPATVTGAGSSTMTVTTTSGTTLVGTYPVTITGTSGNLTQTANVSLAVANAAAIGIQFVGQGQAMASTEVAGVVAQSNWNPANGTTSPTPMALINQAGASTGATVTWNTNGIWSEPITNTAGNNRMMLGYLDTVGGTTTVTVAGLPANPGGYQVYVYADGDNGSATRTGLYQISGTGITTTSVNLTDEPEAYFSGTFTQANNSAGNYVLFTITATGFTITATPGASTDSDPRAPVNAIQIVPLAPTTPSFSLTATPSTETVVVGNATTYTASIGAVDGFSGTVTLSASGLPAGATPSFVPATVTGTGSSILTVTTSSTTPLGTSPLTITGTSGNLTQTANVSLTVAATPPPPNFSLTVTPSTETVVAGSETTYTATIGALNGFGGVVTLSASGLPAGAAASFVPATVTGAGSSTMTVTTTSGTTLVGTYPVTITGTSGNLTQTANVSLAVANAAAIGIQFVGQGQAMASTEVAGVVAQSNWNPANGTTSPTPMALINQAGASTGATVTWNTNGIWSEPITNTAGNNRMMLGYLDTVGGTTTVTVAGLPANPGGYQVYVYADGDNGSATRTGLYQISGTGITTTSVNLTDEPEAYFSGTFTQANNSAGNYVLFTITATGFTITATPGASTDSDPRAPVNAIQIVPLAPTTPSFSLTATPSTETVVVGNATTYTASIGAVDGFSGTVTLSASGLPAGATPSFVPATVTGTGSSILTVTTSSTTPLGTSPLTITGTSGNLTQTANVSLTVAATPPPPNFSLTVTPSTETVVAGSETTYTATIGALNGFGGVVTLSASGLPAGAAASFVPATVTGAGSSTMTVTTTSGTTLVGTYPVTITGTSGNLTQTANVSLAVANAAAIGIQFVGQGQAMASTEVAGVVAQSNWNPANGTTSPTPMALINQAGASTGATVTWNTNGIWSEPITNTAGNNRMMLGYLDTVGGTTTVTVAGLPANPGGYQVYVYADGDNGSATRTGLYQISGTGITTTSVNLTDEPEAYFSGTFTQANNSAGNYVLFTITATGFTITATPGASTDADPRAPVNAIQIVPN